MRYTLSTTLCFLPSVFALWPQPTHYTHGDKVVWFSPDARDSSTTLTQKHGSQPVTSVQKESHLDQSHDQHSLGKRVESPPSVENILQEAINRTFGSIHKTVFVPWKFHPRNESFEPNAAEQRSTVSQVTINQESDKPFGEPRDLVSGDESYTIAIEEDGQVVINTKSPIGTLRALQTFEQLWYAHSSGSGVYAHAPVSISDSAKWSHRGLNLDVSRNWFAPEDVKRTLDAMSTAKLNRLHVHATDAQSWPIEIPAYPELSQKGAYRPQLVWSVDDVREIQTYGLLRGISVYIEIDMPGHTSSVARAYPELITAFNEDEWWTYSAEPPSGQLKLDSPAVNEFVDRLLEDLLPRLSPFTPYYHSGGDEVNLNAYNLDETIKSNDTQKIKPFLQKMVDRIHNIARENELVPIVWEEMLVDWNLTFPSPTDGTNGTQAQQDVIVQVWRSGDALKKVLQRGYRALFGDYNEWYLDCGHGGFINPLPGSAVIADPFLDYCNPLKNWRHIFTYDPLANIAEDLQPLILGGEVHLWSEQSDPVNLDRQLWPRAAAAAEVMWSGPRNVTMIKDASFRLGRWRERAVVDRRIAADMVQMTFCLMGEGTCEE